MNQTQRKYALSRVDRILNNKAHELRVAFSNNPNRQGVPSPINVVPNDGDIICALMGVHNAVKLKPSKELISTYKMTKLSGIVKLQSLVESCNYVEINKAMEHNKKIDEYYKIEVTDKVTKLQVEADKVRDSIMLGGEEDAIIALNSFTNFKV